MTMSGTARLARLAAVIVAVCGLALLAGVRRSSSADLADAVSAPGPAITLPARVIEAASVYAAYVERAAAISPAFADGKSIAASLKTGEAYETQQMQKGMTAYAAII